MPEFTKLCKLPVSIKAFIVTPFILIFKIIFDKHLESIVDTILVTNVACTTKLGEGMNWQTFEKYLFFLYLYNDFCTGHEQA